MAVTDRPWDGNPSRFTAEQWAASCLIDRGGDRSDKSNFSLPVREPSGALNRNAVHAAAARINQVDAPADKKRAAAAALIRCYREIGETPPDSLNELAGARSAAPAGNAEVRIGAERRATPLPVELRALSTPDNPRSSTIGGYAAVFGRDSRLIPGHSGHSAFVERVSHGFFDQEHRAGWPGLQGTGVVARYNHSNDFVLGTTAAGTLRLAVDGIGLDYSVDLPECRSDTLELVTRGDVTASSFTFVVDDNGGDEWSYSGGVTQRTLLSGRLVDVAPVGGALAAYPDATVALRSLAAHKGATEAEIRRLVEQDDLRKLFTRTDRPTLPPETKPWWQIAAEHRDRALYLHARRMAWH